MHVLPVQEITVDDELSYEESAIAIIDRQTRKLRNKEIIMVKVQWQRHSMEECTWESEQAMKDKYPQLFQWSGKYLKFEDEFFLRRVECNTLNFFFIIIIIKNP